ncbi:MAG: hypothetical protein AAFX04_12050 [Pseudomonadota bacterium]
MRRGTFFLATGLTAMLQIGCTAQAKTPERLAPDLVSTPKTEINFQIVDSEDTGIFTRAEADYSLGKIYIVTLENGAPISTEQIGFSDPRYKDSDPWLSPSGDTLYFISDRPTFLGDVREDEDDYDIWRSRRTGGQWTAPEHLGLINSRAGEFGPEVNNGYLYFSSRRGGQYDIYRSRVEGNGFAPPEKLGAPFNTTYHDSDFTLTKNGRVAIWWSTRPGGPGGGGDLYVSHRTGNGWTEATDLGTSINTSALDFTPSLTPNNAILYFATQKPFPGQEEGAADIYRIPVKDIAVLQEALAASAMAQLKEAFGGETVLSNTKTLSYHLDIDRASSASSSEDVFMDFRQQAIAVRSSGESGYRFARGGDAAMREGQALADSEAAEMLASLYANFLYFLTADELELIGPENVSGHGDLTWFRLHARGKTSPLVGLDPRNGRIVKILTDSGAMVMEMDYLKHASGLIWPHRFMVERDGEHILTGRFSKLAVNEPSPAE